MRDGLIAVRGSDQTVITAAIRIRSQGDNDIGALQSKRGQELVDLTQTGLTPTESPDLRHKIYRQSDEAGAGKVAMMHKRGSNFREFSGE